MNLNKKATTAVIVLAIVSLVGICWVQYQWLQDSIQTNRQIFDQKVDLASGMIKESLKDNIDLHGKIVIELINEGILSESTEQNFRNFMDSVMVNGCGLKATYQYGIYTHANDSTTEDFVKMTGNTDRVAINLKECTPGQRNFGWIGLTWGTTTNCNTDGIRSFHYHLGLFYPDSDLYLLSEMKGTLITAVLFILLLVGCFSYTIITIRRQKKLSEIKNDFINNLTHEFKTPIFSIDLASGMLKKSTELKSSPRLMKYAEVIDNESKRLRSQVDKVLQMALIDSGNFKLEKKMLDLHELIQKVTRNFEILIKEKKGEIKLNLNAQKSTLFADETHLKNILYNLLDNAQKYSRSDPQIVITTEDTDDGLALNIQDNGIGIKKDIQRFVFNKFYRAETGNVHDVKGFGLGLSYVKSVIEAHQATIQLVSSPNQGSKFTVKFTS